MQTERTSAAGTRLDGIRRGRRALGLARAWLSMVKRPSAEGAMALERAILRIATPADVARAEAALRASPEIRRLLAERFLPPPHALSDLRGLPAETLGGGYVAHMTRFGLDPAYHPRFDPRRDFDYFCLRSYQTHDIWHVVAGYPAEIGGEVSMLGFYLGQFEKVGGEGAHLLMSASTLIATSVLLHGVLFGGVALRAHLRGFVEGWRRGYLSDSLVAVRWETMWERPLADLRRELRVPAVDAAWATAREEAAR